jgi:ABC-type Fe3+-siderophore transport system permease subunit
MQLLLPASAATGGIALTAAEAVSRFLPGDIPTGVVCAVVGTPFFMWLLMSKRNGEGRDI